MLRSRSTEHLGHGLPGRAAARLLWFFIALCLAALLGDGALAAGEGRSIVIGQVVDQHGNDLESSRDYVIGAKLYFDYINSKGGLNGAHLTQVVKDSGGEPDEALKDTRELIEHDNALVLFGYTGEAAIKAVTHAEVLERSGIALVSPLTGFGDEGDLRNRNAFISRVPYSTELRKIVDHFRTLSLTRFAVVATRADLADRLMPELVQLAAAPAAPNQVGHDPMRVVFQAKAFDPAALDGAMKKVAKSDAQVLIVLGDGLDVGIVARALGEQKTVLPVVGLSLANSRVVLQIAGEKDATGIMLSQVVPNPLRADTPVTREHLALMKKYLDEPPSHLTLEGFMAAKALVEALRDAMAHGGDRAAVLRALRNRPPQDVGGIAIDYAMNAAPLVLVDLTMVRSDGTLLN
jgi:ABC-type branched-subunit amino acid transport system substrate-binding protein